MMNQGILIRHRCFSTSSVFGRREKLAEEYLKHRDWTVEKLLKGRKALKEHTGFARQLQVNWISKDDTVFRAVEEMVKKDVGSLLVCDDVNAERKKFLGIITERDYLRKIVVRNLSSKTTPCEEIMTKRKSISVVTLDHTLYECLHVFEIASFRHLPVITERGDLGENEEDVVAVLSQRDLVHEFRKFHEANLKYIESFIDFPIW